MADIDSTPVAPAEPAAPAPAPAPTDAAPGAPVADPAAPPPAPWEGKSPEELWSLNEKLREENVKYKERFRPAEQALGGWHPDDQQFLVNAIAGLRAEDPRMRQQAAEALRGALDQLSPAEQRAVAAAAEEGEQWDPYDPENVDQRVSKLVDQRLSAERAERQQQEAVADAQKRMESRATELASKHGIPQLGDASSPLGRLLYMTAFNSFPDEPDPMARLDLAAAEISKDLQLRAQDILKAKSADAGPSPAPADAVEPSGSTKPSSMSEARESAKKRLDTILRGQPGT